MRFNRKYLVPLGLVLSLISTFFASHFINFSQAAVLGCIVLMLFFWTTEAIAMPITALLPIFIFSATELMPIKDVLNNYAHPVIYLFFGGFILALGLQRWKIDIWFSQKIIKAVGNSPESVLAGFCLSTAILSMWISNTATAVMMLPLAQSILKEEKNKPVYTKILFLSIAFSANIGGMATLIGTPPNIVLAALYKDYYGVDIGFAQWLQFGLPISLLLLSMMYGLMVYFYRKANEGKTLNFRFEERAENLNSSQKRFLTIFGATAFLWIFRPLLQSAFGLVFLNDTFIALSGAAMLFIIPDTSNSKGKLLHWSHTRDLPWGILLIFGGGLSLAMGIEISGLGAMLGQSLTTFSNWHLFFLMLLIALFALFATELMSNVALVSVFIPIVFLLSNELGLQAFVLAVPLTLAASCAFILPIATPPNMVVYASGKVSFADMASMGWRLNIFALILIVIFWYFLGGLFF